MMTMRDFWRIVSASAGVEGLPDTMDRVADRPFVELGFDSLTLIEAAERLESEGGVKVDLRRLEGLRTPRALYMFVCERDGSPVVSRPRHRRGELGSAGWRPSLSGAAE
ncbi:acyl carrier protein [Streptomyces sp. NPDC056480]|uniref:acyl carrier protein n=1 Tax=Streptomyces sp. NPDC056480 TaxID=3345833 RepID=UPI0036A8CFDE